MNKGVKIKIIIAAVILGVLIAGYYFYISGPKATTIGYSEISATPDLISVYANMEGRDADLGKAQEKALNISDNFLLEMEKLGVPDEDVELLGYNTYEDYDWNTGKIKGYVASQQMNVKITDFNKTILIIRAATNSGALVSGINYELSSSKENEYKAIALKEAGIDARNSMESLAEGLGKNVGRLVSVESQQFYYIPYSYYSREDIAVGNVDAEKASVSVSPQDLEVSASVSATYTLTRF